MSWRAVALALTAALSACTSVTADVQTVCDSDRVSSLERREELSTDEARLAFLLEWSAHNIWTEEGRQLLSELRTPALAWSAKATRLRDAAAAHGIAKCTLPRWIDAHAPAVVP